VCRRRRRLEHAAAAVRVESSTPPPTQSNVPPPPPPSRTCLRRVVSSGVVPPPAGMRCSSCASESIARPSLPITQDSVPAPPPTRAHRLRRRCCESRRGAAATESMMSASLSRARRRPRRRVERARDSEIFLVDPDYPSPRTMCRRRRRLEGATTAAIESSPASPPAIMRSLATAKSLIGRGGVLSRGVLSRGVGRRPEPRRREGRRPAAAAAAAPELRSRSRRSALCGLEDGVSNSFVDGWPRETRGERVARRSRLMRCGSCDSDPGYPSPSRVATAAAVSSVPRSLPPSR
jgi:hypothetical protein